MKTLLVPTDFSTNAKHALVFANNLAQSMKAKIILMYVYTPSAGRYNMISGVLADEIADAKLVIGKKLKNLAAKTVTVKCETRFEVGDTVAEIAEVAEKNNVSMVVMGTHGASGLKKILFGSNTSKLISKVSVPVLTIPFRYRFKKIDKLIYASNLKNPEPEVKRLLPIAKVMNVGVEVLYLDYGWTEGAGADQKFADLAKKIKNKTLSFKKQKVSMEEKMVDALKRYAGKNKNAIMAMFPEEKSFLDNLLLSSRTEDLANGLKSPLISIRKAK